MNRIGKLRALLATVRVANLPSVLGNLALGVVIGDAAELGGRDAGWGLWLLLGSAAVALYGGGNFLNDWWDRGWDAERRPERALPSGFFAPHVYLVTGAAGVLGGCGLAFCAGSGAGFCALAIAVAIVLYTVIHKRTAWSVVPMGFCRAMLPLMGAAGVTGVFRWGEGGLPVMLRVVVAAGLALGMYIAGLSLEARNESRPVPSLALRRGSLALLMAAALPGLWVSGWFGYGWWFAGVAPYAWWLLRVPRGSGAQVGVRVSHLLAGIPWVDGIIFVPIGLAVAVEGGLWAPGLAVPAVVILLVGAGRLLQRVAPAT